MMIFFMAWVWMDVVFMAKAVAGWGAILQRRGALSKFLSADIFGLEGDRKLQFVTNWLYIWGFG